MIFLKCRSAAAVAPPEWQTPTPNPSALGATSGVTPPTITASRSTPTPPRPNIKVWDMTQLTSFNQGGGDVILGQGSCGTVHLFRHEETQTPLAVKVFALPTNDQQALVKKVGSMRHEATIQELLGEFDVLNKFFLLFPHLL